MLGSIAYALVFMLAIALALFCARFEDTFMDRFVCRIGTVAFYVPAFWMGGCWCSFSASTSNCCRAAVPTGSGNPGDMADRLRHLVLPLIVMVASHLWYYAYMIRNKLLDEIRRDYVLLARAKGLGRTRVLLSHCLRNVLPHHRQHHGHLHPPTS